jgi:hypothetical protein
VTPQIRLVQETNAQFGLVMIVPASTRPTQTAR